MQVAPMLCSRSRSFCSNSDLSPAMADSSPTLAPSSDSSLARRLFLASAISSFLASLHELYSAGSSVTDVREKSLTLIWLSTCCLTMGRIVSYNDDEI